MSPPASAMPCPGPALPPAGIGVSMNLKQIFFVSMAGLRGSLSLILVQTVIKIAPDTVRVQSSRVPVSSPSGGRQHVRIAVS